MSLVILLYQLIYVLYSTLTHNARTRIQDKKVGYKRFASTISEIVGYCYTGDFSYSLKAFSLSHSALVIQ